MLSAAFLRGNGVIHRTQKVIQGDDNGHVGRPCEVSLAPPYPELFASYGASAVTRTSDRGHLAEARMKRFLNEDETTALREGLNKKLEVLKREYANFTHKAVFDTLVVKNR